MERWERAALLFDAENVATLKEKLGKDGVEFHPLTRFLDFGTYEAMARWDDEQAPSNLVLSLRRKGWLNEHEFDKHAAEFYLGEKFKAFPVVGRDGWLMRAYCQIHDLKAEEVDTPLV